MTTFLKINKFINHTTPTTITKLRKVEQALKYPHTFLNQTYHKQIIT